MPFEQGNTLIGFGVVRDNPWSFEGIFKTRNAAQARADELGSDYHVKYGENREGSDDFVWMNEGLSPDEEAKTQT